MQHKILQLKSAYTKKHTLKCTLYNENKSQNQNKTVRAKLSHIMSFIFLVVITSIS